MSEPMQAPEAKRMPAGPMPQPEPTPEPEHDDGGRFPLLDPGTLRDDQRAVYDAVAGGPRADGPFLVVDGGGRLAGPFNALLYSPAIGQAVQALGAALRFGGSLPDRTREIIICAVAAEWDSAYEWYAHSRVAALVGINATELETLRTGGIPETLDDAEAAALNLAAALMRTRTVDAALHARVLEHFGHPGVAELALLVGYYQALAGLLAAGDVPAPVPDSVSTTTPTTTPTTTRTTTHKGEHP